MLRLVKAVSLSPTTIGVLSWFLTHCCPLLRANHPHCHPYRPSSFQTIFTDILTADHPHSRPSTFQTILTANHPPCRPFSLPRASQLCPWPLPSTVAWGPPRPSQTRPRAMLPASACVCVDLRKLSSAQVCGHAHQHISAACALFWFLVVLLGRVYHKSPRNPPVCNL